MASEQAQPTTCPNCGQIYDPSRTTYCDKCGHRFPWASGEPAFTDVSAVRFLFGLASAVVFAVVGFVLVTRETGFPNVMGWFSLGMAMLAITVTLHRE